MKFVNKKKLEFKQGFFVVKNKVMTKPELIEQVNKLQYLDEVLGFIASNQADIDKAMSPREVPSFEAAKRDGIRQAPSTTALDDYVDQVNAVIADIETLEIVDKADGILAKSFGELLEFVRSDEVMLTSADYCSKPMLLDPLELKESEIVEVVEVAVRIRDRIAAVDESARRKIPELWD